MNWNYVRSNNTRYSLRLHKRIIISLHRLENSIIERVSRGWRLFRAGVYSRSALFKEIRKLIKKYNASDERLMEQNQYAIRW